MEHLERLMGKLKSKPQAVTRYLSAPGARTRTRKRRFDKSAMPRLAKEAALSTSVFV
jgi:hypothetical protein